MKNPTTFEDQLGLLLSRGLQIEDESKCLNVLKSVNYYNFTAYLLPFKQKDNSYFEGTSFERIYDMYEFDWKMRMLLFSIIGEIESFLKTQISYYIAHKYGAIGYLEDNKYNSNHNHSKFMSVLDTIIYEHRNTLIVKHHNKKYDGVFPIWVIVDFFSIGNLSYFYADLLSEDRKNISKSLFNVPYTYLESWLKCLTVLRNRCAHYSRLYYSNFNSQPRLTNTDKKLCTGKLFDQIIMLKKLYSNKSRWNSSFITGLEALINQYQGSIKLNHIGFPLNWKNILENEEKVIVGKIDTGKPYDEVATIS